MNVNEGKEKTDDMQQRFPHRFDLATLGLFVQHLGLLGHQDTLIMFKGNIMLPICHFIFQQGHGWGLVWI